MLNLQHKHIQTIQEFENLILDQDLNDKSANELKIIPDCTALPNLVILHLNNNKISDLTNTSALTNLQELDLRSNKLESLAQFSTLPNAVWLSLACNGIRDLDHLPYLPKLQYLGLFGNYIGQDSPNPTETLTHIMQIIGDRLPSLSHLYLDGNPVSNLPDYKQTCISYLSITQLDGINF